MLLNWNPVLNKFIEIKNRYIKNYNIDTLYTYNKKKECCLEYWVRMLNIPEYKELISYLQFTEYKDRLLIRYKDFSTLFGIASESENPFHNFNSFWRLDNGFYMECRSVTINIKENELITTPFRKFQNLNECEENNIDNIKEKIQNAKCVEFSNKLDGSMQCARWYKDEVVMTGSKSLDPNQAWRLKDGYSMLRKRSNYVQMLKDNPHLTFIFEYISMQDAHVVNYKPEQEGLYLVGIRDVNSGKECSYKEIKEFSERYDIPTTEIYNKTLNEVITELDEKKSNEAEGFVLNIDGYKVKIKYNDYTKMHKILSMLSAPNLIIQSIADGSFDDLYSKTPKAYIQRVTDIAAIVFSYIEKKQDELLHYYIKAPKDNKKDFMIWVKDNVPNELQALIKAKYLHEPYNFLKSKAGKYKKLKEIEEYTGIYLKSISEKSEEKELDE